MSEADQPLEVFISYSHRDDEWRARLDSHLSLLQQQGILHVWHDRRLLGGEDWAHTIEDKLKAADIVLLLVSAEFIESPYCQGVEMKLAMQQNAQGRSRVVPILVRKCDWESGPFGQCQAFPRDNKPVANHPAGVDEALTEVAKELRKLATDIIAQRSRSDEASRDRPGPVLIPRRSWWQRNRKPTLALATTGLAVIAAVVAGLFAWSRVLVEDGERWLRVGDYQKAAESFAGATRRNPFDARARLGGRIAEVGLMVPELASHGAEFSRALDALAAERPDDPDVLLLIGDRAWDEARRMGQQGAAKWAEAQAAYEKAIQPASKFPEAHARLAMLFDLAGDLPAAREHAEQATSTGGNDALHVARYRSQLAGVLAQQGNWDQAMQLYEADSSFPLSAVEAAMLLWSRAGEGDALPRARSKLEQAQQLLGQSEPMRQLENRYAWLFKAGDDGVLVGRVESKLCFTALVLAVTDKLQGNTNQTGADLARQPGEAACSATKADATFVVCARLAEASGGADSEAQRKLSEARAWLNCSAATPLRNLPSPGYPVGPSSERRTRT